MSYQEYLDPVEKGIIDKIIQKALELKYMISVNDEEEEYVRRSRNYAEVTEAVGISDVTYLFFRNEEGLQFNDTFMAIYGRKEFGGILLVHGNGEDVISDYTDNEHMKQLVDHALKATHTEK